MASVPLADPVLRGGWLLERRSGAGLLGFTINPPASLYYVQGLNITAAHGHAALFGVYGMLGIGLMLFCLRGLYPASRHADGCWPRRSGA